MARCARVTGKAGGVGKWSPRGAGKRQRVSKISGNRAAAHPGQDRRFPGGVTHPRTGRASARSWGPGQPGSRVAIDWVTGRSCTSAMKAERRLNVQSGLRNGQGDGITLPGSSVAVRDRGH